MQPLRFALSLTLSGLLLLAAQRLMDRLTPSKTTAPAEPTISTNALLALPAALIEAGGVPMSSRIRHVRLSPAAVADETERALTAKLDAWHSARGVAGALPPLDNLSVPFRIDRPGWSMVGLLRQPEGFAAPGFAKRSDLAHLAPSDLAEVVLAIRKGSGDVTAVFVFELFARDLGGRDPTLPASLAPLNSQTTLYRTVADGAGIAIRKTALPLPDALKARLAELHASGAAAKVLAIGEGETSVAAAAPGWQARIFVAAAEAGAATEIVSYQPLLGEAQEVGSLKP